MSTFSNTVCLFLLAILNCRNSLRQLRVAVLQHSHFVAAAMKHTPFNASVDFICIKTSRCKFIQMLPARFRSSELCCHTSFLCRFIKCIQTFSSRPCATACVFDKEASYSILVCIKSRILLVVTVYYSGYVFHAGKESNILICFSSIRPTSERLYASCFFAFLHQASLVHDSQLGACSCAISSFSFS